MVVDEVKCVAVGEGRAAEVSREAERYVTGLVEPLQLSRIQFDLERAEVVSELGVCPHADNRDRHGALLLC